MLWGDEPPRSAGNTLQSYVSDLRAILGPEAIFLTDHSYELDLCSAGIDALRFEELLRRLPDMEYSAGGPVLKPSSLVRTCAEMQVKFTPEG